jgi:hypothetical protein
MRAKEFMKEFITQPELDRVEDVCNRLWNQLGIDIEFSRHFLDRVNDERNGKEITVEELIRLFKKEYKFNGELIANLSGSSEAVMKDILTSVNIPFVVQDKKLDRTLVAKTVMRKPNFQTTSPMFKVK